MRVLILTWVFYCITIKCFSLTDNARVSVLTYEPGSKLYTIFGHTAIRINDSSVGIDKIYNFGTFRFNAPLFLIKFFGGNLDYYLSITHYNAFVHRSLLEGRKIHEQFLNLTQAEIDDIYLKLEQTYNSEERFYRYDFFYDNCATRIRDVIFKVKSQKIEYDTSGFCCLTFRELLKPYVSGNYWIDLGINLALGKEADQQARSLEFMFLPDYIYLILQKTNMVEKSGIMLDFSDHSMNRNHLDRLILILFMTMIFILTAMKKTRKAIFYIYNSWIAFHGVLLTLIALFSANTAFRNNFNICWTLPALLILLLSKSRHRKIAEFIYVMFLLLIVVLRDHFYQGFSVTFLPWMVLLIVMYLIDLHYRNEASESGRHA